MKKKKQLLISLLTLVFTVLLSSKVMANEISETFVEKLVEYEYLEHHISTVSDKQFCGFNSKGTNLLWAPFQLTEEELTNLSTEELTKVVLKYPYMSDIYAFNSIDDGIKALQKRYNGLAELLKRKDRKVEILEVYVESGKQLLEKRPPKQGAINLVFLEAILAQEEFDEDRKEITATFMAMSACKNMDANGEIDRTYLDVLDTINSKVTKKVSELQPLRFSFSW